MTFPWQNNETPVHVNEKGYEWYVDKNMTEYAHDKGLKELICYFVRKGDEVTRILVDTKTQSAVYESQNLEAMAVHIDLIALAEN